MTKLIILPNIVYLVLLIYNRHITRFHCYAKIGRPFTAFEANGKLYQFCRLTFDVTNGVSFFQRTIDSVIESYNLKGCLAYLDNITIFGKNQIEHDINLNAFFDVAKKLNLTFNQQKSIISVKEIKMLGYLVSKGSIGPDLKDLNPSWTYLCLKPNESLNESLACLLIIQNGSLTFPIKLNLFQTLKFFLFLIML